MITKHLLMDNLFQKSETQKNMAVSDGAWDRVNDLLRADWKKVRWLRWRIVGIAASFTVLFSALFLFQTSAASDYHLENLEVAEIDLLYSTEDIAMLNETHELITGDPINYSEAGGLLRLGSDD
jgi:hypothetical protein